MEHPPPCWVDKVEPHQQHHGNEGRALPPCYSNIIKADLLPGTFVLIGGNGIIHTATCNERGVVARIVKPVYSSRADAPFHVQVNIFKKMYEIAGGPGGEGMLLPQGLVENHLRHLPEVVQTSELREVQMSEVTNLAFVFTEESLHDDVNLFFTCQGMAYAFLLRYRLLEEKTLHTRDENAAQGRKHLSEIPSGYCLPFPSSYGNSKYCDCFPRRVWNSLISVKLEIAKLLGRYSQQQGLFGRERTRMYLTAETWGYLGLQFSSLFSALTSPELNDMTSKRVRIHRLVESGLVLKAVRIQRKCSVMRFATKSELLGFSRVFGESATAGPRSRLPKIASPKALLINDVINVVCGADAREPVFYSRTQNDGIDLEFDGISELFITIRYSRYAYTRSTSSGACDPLLSSLIRCSNPHVTTTTSTRDDTSDDDDDDSVTILRDSEFEDDNGCVYRVISINATHVNARCCYPMIGNDALYGSEKAFDHARTKDLIRRRLYGD